MRAVFSVSDSFFLGRLGALLEVVVLPERDNVDLFAELASLSLPSLSYLDDWKTSSSPSESSHGLLRGVLPSSSLVVVALAIGLDEGAPIMRGPVFETLARPVVDAASVDGGGTRRALAILGLTDDPRPDPVAICGDPLDEPAFFASSS